MSTTLYIVVVSFLTVTIIAHPTKDTDGRAYSEAFVCVVSTFLIVPGSPGVASQQRNLWETGMDECGSRRRRLFFEEGGLRMKRESYKSCKGG